MSRPDRYLVAVNDEEQHALWPEGAPLPAGWREEGFRGTEDECAAHVDAVWPDIRPLSVRRRLAEGPAAPHGGTR
ncbi:MbtH family protein [Streptomyces sp. NPDC088785]|uniref:MbtH family protein n=1 Tax=Streptomyces sp. NPDC088785 TaxID=3365897 RepID=UPI0038215396